LVVKLLHILLAITAVGFTLAFFVILSSKDKTREQLQFQLHLCHRLEAIAVPCFVLLLVSGLGMKLLSTLAWGTFWFASSLTIMLVALALGITVVGPTLNKQVALIDQPNPPMDELDRLANRSKVVRGVLLLMVLTMVSMMVFKPTL
jgi:hypothetical protein